uniref:Uncharacterized protein n=1 Tax=Arundo donax TaxID=35708 RepID=A0A0A9FL33_ARUDO
MSPGIIRSRTRGKETRASLQEK